MRWAKHAPRIAAAWTTAYAAVHAWWAVKGAPPLGKTESFVPGGWIQVAPAAVAAVATALMSSKSDRSNAATWGLAGLGWAGGVGLLARSFMFPASVMSVVFGQKMSAADWGALVVQAGGVAGGALTIMSAIEQQRRARGACSRCGRVHGRSPERRTDSSPQWAYIAGYLAVASFAARFSADVILSMTDGDKSLVEAIMDLPPLPGALLALAGTLLPLSLVHQWGRIWPRWVLPFAGRQVPRWIPLGTGLFVGGGLTGYFGIGATTAWVTGNNMDGPLWWILTVLPAYTLWGIGLLVASVSYLGLTKPECPLRDQDTAAVEPASAEPEPPAGLGGHQTTSPRLP